MGEGLGVRAMRVERAGVRGNGANFVSMAEMFPGTVKLDESPVRAGGFPGQMIVNTPRTVPVGTNKQLIPATIRQKR